MIYILSLVGPFFLLLVEKLLPYPFIIEEIYKFLLIERSKQLKAINISIAGILFSLSEAVFYFMNPIYQNSPDKILTRLLLVTPMHLTTMLVMFYSMRKNKPAYKYMGLIAAVLIHLSFNYLGSI